MNNCTGEDCPFGPGLQRYWNNRYQLFSKFDEGILIDKEGLYSVKPEASALEIGELLQGQVVLDAFAGVGGSAIGLARAGHSVVSVEKSKDRMKMAINNAKIYGVAEQIRFINADFLNVVAEIEFDAVYYDPEWGGPEYYNSDSFCLNSFVPDGNLLIEIARSRRVPMAITVPNNFVFSELAALKHDYELVDYHVDDQVAYTTVFLDFRDL